ncbi:MAG TPA: matrixin family metalloprotease [Gemmatales bacterium]|nr:matrixin family metalloprotease [Gemmatales bacterium]
MKRSARLTIESLEDRNTPATFGIPQSDPLHLTISFVPDGTNVAGTPSALFQTLNALSSTSAWQNEILRAAGAWANVANINFGVVSDNGVPLGAATPIDGNASFGVIRIAAKPLANNVLAVGIPPNEFGAGTWAGDIIFNTNTNLAKQKTDLYTVFLHEIGHALGLPGSADPRSVMYQKIAGKRIGLALSDVVTVDNLYGTRLPDQNETPGKGNDTLKLATRMKYEDTGLEAWTGTVPLVSFGDITRSTDVDVFSFQNLLDYHGPISFRLLTQGISLLNPKISVLDAQGKVIDSRLSQQTAGADLVVTLPASTAGAKYFIRVEAESISGFFSVGRYALSLTLDQRLTTPASTITSVLRGPFDAFPAGDLESLFSQNPEDALFHQDDSSDDTAKNAGRLTSNNAVGSTFDVVGSLQSADDVDFYRVRVPRLNVDPVSNMTVTITPYSIHGVMPDVQLFDKNQKPVAFNVLSNGNGVLVIQSVGLKVNDDYFIRIANAPGQASTGNYHANFRFGRTATTLETFFSGSVAATGATSKVYVAEPQLFHLLLSSNNGVALTMTIEDTAGNTLFTLTSNGPPASGQPLLLQPGEYHIRLSSNGQPTRATLRGDLISDPIGSVVVDPNSTPPYTNPDGTNTYPNGTKTTKPFLWLALTV